MCRSFPPLEEAMATSATPVRPFLIEVAHFLMAKRIVITLTVTDATAFSVNVNNFRLIDLVLC